MCDQWRSWWKDRAEMLTEQIAKETDEHKKSFLIERRDKAYLWSEWHGPIPKYLDDEEGVAHAIRRATGRTFR